MVLRETFKKDPQTLNRVIRALRAFKEYARILVQGSCGGGDCCAHENISLKGDPSQHEKQPSGYFSV